MTFGFFSTSKLEKPTFDKLLLLSNEGLPFKKAINAFRILDNFFATSQSYNSVFQPEI